MTSRSGAGLVVAIAAASNGAVTVQEFGWASFTPSALNANGTVAAGYSTLSDGLSNQAIRWSLPGTAQNIGAGKVTGKQAFATAVSDDGMFLAGLGEAPTMQAFWWTASAGYVKIGNFPQNPSGLSSVADVSGDGNVVVGSGVVSDWQAFRWTLSGGLVSLGVLPGASSSNAYATTRDGSIVVGTSGASAFRWTSATGMTALSPLTSATAINSDGAAIAGNAGAGVACLVRGGFVRLLGTFAGGTNQSATGISGDGSLIVGKWQKPDEPVFSDRYRSCLWTARGGLVDLPVYLTAQGFDTTGWYFHAVSCVSRDGRVLMGYGVHNGVNITWRATIPAPCVSDLNNDGMVDDADFSRFAAAYDVLDCADAAMAQWCPADLNLDSLVNDEDFVLFAAAYNELMCP